MHKILITGGNFINKGAQSMLFCLVDSLKTKYPESEIVMIDLFPTLKVEDKDKYNFRIVNMHIRTVLRMAFPVIKLIVKPKPISNPEKEIKSHFATADLILDISGYGVSSHNQSPLWTYATLFPVKLARKKNIPFVFLPQSIGPFDFKGWKKLVIWPLVKKYLSYPKAIFIREPECRVYTDKIRKEGVIDSFDLVLQSPKINLNHIYCEDQQDLKANEVNHKSVIVVPNKQLTKLKTKQEVVVLFSGLINELLQNGEQVAIVRHSNDDKTLCDEIYREVDHSDVQLVNRDLSPYEIQQIFDDSKAVVTARYHGLIHALKLSKPCLVIGWANKYKHVMKSFHMDEYQFDIRNIDESKMKASLMQLVQNEEEISTLITNKLKEIKATDIFNYIR
ncbi:polysaccharide pyruvyl transferase family protein [Plebeiibacterium sediminum]|uniref:Polysaccharide pyruvyl transferase family protein n=1 Tax=Plebeiibacterium sediminum TaxID=2992112 RepID=A0AAE3M565_9BACT|nr:polysaccharide pyruvyl transferase family protein [Plebeiobacterium sediminum]MCW3787146.1 polysaccharide pyruvyl transferase family protein [Plebeiobacterium sediminum]